MRYQKYFWEVFQDRLNVELHALNVGNRYSNVMSLDDDKKYARFSNFNHTRNYEGLKVVTHPNLRKDIEPAVKWPEWKF